MKTWRFTEFEYQCTNPECNMVWVSPSKHDIYCAYCRSFGAIINISHKEQNEIGEIKDIE